MGFSHPNVFGTFVLSIMSEYIYLRYRKLNILDVAIIVIAIWIIGYYADSRTSQMCLGILIIFCLFVRKNEKKFGKKINNVVSNTFFICAAISFISAFLYSRNNWLMIKINEIITGRLNFIVQFFKEYKISAFGNEIIIIGTKLSSETGLKPWILDNAYSLILLRYGIITFLMLGVYLNLFFKKAYENKEYIIISIMLVFLLFGLLESGIVKVEYNIFWLYFSKLLYNKKTN